MKIYLETFNLERLFKWGTFAVFFGWGLIHLFWDGPYRTLFWSQDHVRWLVSGVLGYSWSEYMGNLAVDTGIDMLTRSIGVILLVCSFIFLLSQKYREMFKYLIYLGSFCLFFMFLIKYQASHYQIAMLIEHGSQFGIPLVAFFYLSKRWNFEESQNVLKILLMMTFFGHGLYALGLFYPVPGRFIDMTIEILGFSEAGAIEFLIIAGGIDLLLCLLIWIPSIERYALAYCVFWGLLTAMARPVSFILLEVNDLNSLFHWLVQATYRAPHFVVPLILFNMTYVSKRQRSAIANAQKAAAH